jgi:hypothetical protein
LPGPSAAILSGEGDSRRAVETTGYRYEPAPGGGTIVSNRVRVGGLRLLQPLVRRNVQRDVERLREVLESGTDGGSTAMGNFNAPESGGISSTHHFPPQNGHFKTGLPPNFPEVSRNGRTISP